jgi:hypothetical protein
MRYNATGEAYCHNANEVLEILDEEECEPDDVFLSFIDAPEGDETMWCGEVAETVSGDTLFYIEAPTEAEIHNIAAQVGIDDLS